MGDSSLESQVELTEDRMEGDDSLASSSTQNNVQINAAKQVSIQDSNNPFKQTSQTTFLTPTGKSDLAK